MKPNDHKAYAEYCNKFNLKPTLCVYPMMYFLDRNNDVVKVELAIMYKRLGWSLNPSTGRYSKGKKKDTLA